MKNEPTEKETAVKAKPTFVKEPMKAKEKKVKATKAADTIDDVKPKDTTKKTTKSVWMSFEERCEQCKTFKEEYGHCKIKTAMKEYNNIGVWVQEMRRNYKLQMQGKKARNVINDEHIESLNELGFHWGFEVDPFSCAESDASWEANFAKLVKFKEEQGNFDVPVHGEGVDAKLGNWVRAQRHQKKQRDSKVKCHINPQRIKKLNEIGFNWDGTRKAKE